MDSIIRQLFYGNLDPNARCYTKDCSCKKAMDIIAKNEEILIEELEDKEKRCLSNMLMRGAKSTEQKYVKYLQQVLEWVPDLLLIQF